MHEIFTIGYGGRTTTEFVALLERYGIETLADVRSSPYSQYHTDFDRPHLRKLLERSDMRYVFMGDSLGGRPDDRDCYSYSPARRKALLDPSKCETKDFYLAGISHLKKLARGTQVALMCSELDPQNCHRSYVIGKTLERRGIQVVHIDRNGQRKPQAELPAMVYQESLL